MRDIAHYTVHCPCEVDFVLVVHGDANEELRLAGIVQVLSQLIASFYKVVRITGDSGIPHVGELDIIAPWEKAVQDGRDLALQNELAVDERHLTLRHLGLPGSSPRLHAIRCWAVMLVLLVIIITSSRVGHE